MRCFQSPMAVDTLIYEEVLILYFYQAQQEVLNAALPRA
jgi:hypothetical protein